MAGFLVSGLAGFLVLDLVLSGGLFALILLLGFGGCRFARIASLRGCFGVYGGSFGSWWFSALVDYGVVTVAVLVIWWFVCLPVWTVFWFSGFRFLCGLV